ncbi:hypothetical protein T440DRAFT_467343 [Plenodomus tracheiphilus IPT5]|uniref:DUF2293 domain-containing protein n=1 Tax=Plenodomus tracheiphilus IPT5 TaxID=1408161 RepID=A0A6A7BCD7_9PLEO|nr:hypothetical protein T440DRAFT_467343 [Plenodomus tracheiphilus IPT5]
MIETTVSSNTAIPKGYGFLPKGIRYKTLHCRKLTHEAGKKLYVVVDKKNQVGIRVPKFILHQVHTQAKETLSARRDAVAKRDATDIAKADAEMRKQFFKMPEIERMQVLKHGFQKSSGRVGRTGLIPLSKKVLLAVIAHVRHKHTGYDTLLSSGIARIDARKATRKKIEAVLKLWGLSADISWYFRDDVSSDSELSEYGSDAQSELNFFAFPSRIPMNIQRQVCATLHHLHVTPLPQWHTSHLHHPRSDTVERTRT